MAAEHEQNRLAEYFALSSPGAGTPPPCLGNLRTRRQSVSAPLHDQGRFRRAGDLQADPGDPGVRPCPIAGAEFPGQQEPHSRAAGGIHCQAGRAPRYIFPLADLVEKEAPVSYQAGKWSTRCRRAMRQFRIGVYNGDFEKIDEAKAFLDEYCRQRLAQKAPAVPVVAEAFEPEWFSTLSGSLQFYLLEQILRYSMDQLQHYPPVLSYLADESVLTVSPDVQVPFHRLLAGYYLLEGRFTDLETLACPACGFLPGLRVQRHPGVPARRYRSGPSSLYGRPSAAPCVFRRPFRLFLRPARLCSASSPCWTGTGSRTGFLSSSTSPLPWPGIRSCPEEVPYLFIDALVSFPGQHSAGHENAQRTAPGG